MGRTLRLKGSGDKVIKVVGLHGKAQVGKDTVGKFFTEKFGFKRIGFADAVRDALLALNPIIYVSHLEIIELGLYTEEMYLFVSIEKNINFYRFSDIYNALEGDWEKLKKIQEVRKLLQRIGTDAGREIHGEDCWIDIAKRKVIAAEDTGIIFTDVRFDNEADAVQRSPNGLVIEIVRPGHGAVNNHISESGISGELVDFRIVNDGNIEDLYSKLDRIFYLD